MLPWDRPKGRQAYKRLRCFIGNKINEKEKLKKFEQKKPIKFATIKQISELI